MDIRIPQIFAPRFPSPTVNPNCQITSPKDVVVTWISNKKAAINWTPGSGGTKQLLRVGVNNDEVDNGCPGNLGTPCVVKEELTSAQNTFTTGDVFISAGTHIVRVVNFQDSSCWKDAWIFSVPGSSSALTPTAKPAGPTPTTKPGSPSVTPKTPTPTNKPISPTPAISPTPTKTPANRPLIYGINPPTSDDPNIDGMLGKIKSSCAKVMRTGFDWAIIQPNGPSDGNWGAFDKVYQSAAANNIEIVALLVQTPKWANGGHDEPWLYPPTNDHKDDYINFLKSLVGRYPNIKYFEFWNEASCCGWHPGCSSCDQPYRAQEYIPWMKVTYETIKSVKPDAQIATTGDDLGDTSWIDAIYSLSKGANSCSGKPCWDAIGYHSYPIDWGRLKNFYGVMAKNNDAGKSIWITEYGRKGGGLGGNDIKDSLTKLASSEYSFVSIAAYHAIADSNTEHLGLVDENLNPKTNGGYDAFRSIACGK